MPRVFDTRMRDGSRHFGDLPETYDPATPQWDQLRTYASTLVGAADVTMFTDRIVEAWIDFTFRGHAFSLNNQQGYWWFFVGDPSCPDGVLACVLDHFETLLDPPAHHARAGGPIAKGNVRVVVFEPNGRIGRQDFPDRSAAESYAADATRGAEDDRGSSLAYLFDDEIRRV